MESLEAHRRTMHYKEAREAGVKLELFNVPPVVRVLEHLAGFRSRTLEHSM